MSSVTDVVVVGKLRGREPGAGLGGSPAPGIWSSVPGQACWQSGGRDQAWYQAFDAIGQPR